MRRGRFVLLSVLPASRTGSDRDDDGKGFHAMRYRRVSLSWATIECGREFSDFLLKRSSKFGVKC